MLELAAVLDWASRGNTRSVAPGGGGCVIPTTNPGFRGCAFSVAHREYRALSRVTDPGARTFYEREAIESGWSKDQLERQLQSFLYQRILSNQGEAGLVAACREREARAVAPTS